MLENTTDSQWWCHQIPNLMPLDLALHKTCLSQNSISTFAFIEYVSTLQLSDNPVDAAILLPFSKFLRKTISHPES